MLTSVEPANAQFADAPSTSQPSQAPSDPPSKAQANDEVTQNAVQPERIVTIEDGGMAWESAQFTPTPKPSDSDNPSPTPAT